MPLVGFEKTEGFEEAALIGPREGGECDEELDREFEASEDRCYGEVFRV